MLRNVIKYGLSCVKAIGLVKDDRHVIVAAF